jgi:hypothetical protein
MQVKKIIVYYFDFICYLSMYDEKHHQYALFQQNL